MELAISKSNKLFLKDGDKAYELFIENNQKSYLSITVSSQPDYYFEEREEETSH